MKENKNISISTNNGKTVALIAYLTIIGLIAAVIMNNKNATSLGRFHIRQSIGITVTAMAVGLLRYVPLVGNIVGLIIGIVILVALILSILSAVKGEEQELPFIGNLFQKWFSMI
ncbi:hypothetical protein ACR780_12050 [Sphingobacterium faecium]|uniref:hypothetical protein n=1 Tax=Sphingobacterium faecium TaxID=34087 RepID=UPI003DA699FC